MPGPDRRTMRAAVALAGHAPSIFNLQPWRWEMGASTLHLLLDRSHELPVTDPQGRESTVSCGVSLQHAALALRTLGWHAHIHRMPNPATPQRLAVIETTGPGEPSATDISLARAASTRHTDRRPYSPEPVPSTVLAHLVRAGEEAGAGILVADGDQRYALATAFVKAAAMHGADADYRRELSAWTGRGSTAVEGVPASTTPTPGAQYGDVVLRDFGRVAASHAETSSAAALGTLLLFSTDADDQVAHLRAGEAAGAVLCSAEAEGLSASPLTEAFEIPHTRAAVRREVLLEEQYPQFALRIGRPAEATRPYPAAHRRPIQDILHDLGSALP